MMGKGEPENESRSAAGSRLIVQICRRQGTSQSVVVGWVVDVGRVVFAWGERRGRRGRKKKLGSHTNRTKKIII
jgi:hypothetical protein